MDHAEELNKDSLYETPEQDTRNLIEINNAQPFNVKVNNYIPNNVYEIEVE